LNTNETNEGVGLPISMKCLLVYPPFADPTQAYVSLPVLKGYLESRGIGTETADFNIEATRFFLSGKQIRALCSAMREKFLRLDQTKSLDVFEQLQYKKLYAAIPGIEDIIGRDSKPAEVLKNKQLFYDYNRYLRAAADIECILKGVSALGFPFRFGFNEASHFTLPWSMDMIDGYVTGNKSPLEAFYADYFSSRVQVEPDMVGISLTFISQIPETFVLARRIKRVYPHVGIVAGGPCLSQIACYCRPETIARLFDYFDFLCVGDGEETLENLIKCPDQNKNRAKAALASIPNLVFKDQTTGEIIRTKSKPFDIRQSPAPDYSDTDLDLYLAPERIILYPATRNCYWRKCSFCTYGVSFSGSYHYREIPADKAASELASLQSRYKTNRFYISCDVLSPSYAKKLAREIISRNTEIVWSSDLRIEKEYDEELCGLLFDSGLRSAAFGIESGSDHVLTLIDKGISVNTIRSVNRTFGKCGIATEWMTFTYHPGEEPDDAFLTLNLIEDEIEEIDLFIAGEFQLVPGSRVYNSPAQYGIKRIFYTNGDDFRLFPLFKLNNFRKSSLMQRDSIDGKIDEIAGRFALSHYPWAGAISTLHTFLYFLRFGKKTFRSRASEKSSFIDKGQNIKHSPAIKPRFSLRKIEGNESLLFSGIHNGLNPKAIRGDDPNEPEAPLSDDYLMKIAAKIPRLFPVKRQSRK
jgi:anaerobic magnesium-protoporphyrin IX monomethyl ester cyclase